MWSPGSHPSRHVWPLSTAGGSVGGRRTFSDSGDIRNSDLSCEVEPRIIR